MAEVDREYVPWRAAMWWSVGYSSYKSGETVEWVDPLYMQDFRNGRKAAGCQE